MGLDDTTAKQSPREFWITQGEYGKDFATEDFYDDEKDELMTAGAIEYTDEFYPMVCIRPFKNGIHVIEYSHVEELERENKKLKIQHQGCCALIDKTDQLTQQLEACRNELANLEERHRLEKKAHDMCSDNEDKLERELEALRKVNDEDAHAIHLLTKDLEAARAEVELLKKREITYANGYSSADIARSRGQKCFDPPQRNEHGEGYIQGLNDGKQERDELRADLRRAIEAMEPYVNMHSRNCSIVEYNHCSCDVDKLHECHRKLKAKYASEGGGE